MISRRVFHDWDLAAAQLLIAEAGGRLTAADAAALVLNRPEPRHSGFAAPGDDRLRRALLERLGDWLARKHGPRGAMWGRAVAVACRPLYGINCVVLATTATES